MARELIQMSSRRRTYLLRVFYALALYATAGFIYFDRVRWAIGDNTWGLLGTGSQLLEAVAAVQIVGIWILLPAIVASALAVEKERQTLPLLFLTRLGPITLLLEQLVSRLVPMFSLLLLPLLTLLQIGCLALCCSACCRTPVSAFITGYLVTAAYLQLELSRSIPFLQMVVYSPPILAASTCAFVMARLQLVRRAFLPPRNHLRELFGRIDALLTRLNDRFTGSIVLVRDGEHLPEDDPVAWHETTRKSLGTFRYLLRVLILLEVPVLVISVLALATAGNPFPEPVSVVQIFTWFLVILIISARASTLFSGERSRQTLEILLSTPLTTRELVRQKYRGVNRLILVLSVPLLTAVAFATY